MEAFAPQLEQQQPCYHSTRHKPAGLLRSLQSANRLRIFTFITAVLLFSGIPASAARLSAQVTKIVVESASATAAPLSSSQLAQLKAAAEAQKLLNETSQSKEAEAITAMLANDDSQLQAVQLPKGSMAWCPVLKLNTTGSPKEPNPLHLANSINSKYIMKDMTWQAAMSDDLASIAVAGIWWSAKQRPVPVTPVTQASVDRLPQLYSQCRSWAGPLSAVMYMGLVQDTVGKLTASNIELLKKAAIHVTNLFLDMERDESACKLDIMMVYEVYTERKAMMLYPINVLRNIARLQARTPLIALVDVDMLMNNGFYQDLLDQPAFRQQLIDGAKAKTAYVLPAFETYGQTYEAAALADLLASRDKSFLIDSIKSGIAGPFDHQRFPQGHNWTLFDRWYQSDQAYQVAYGNRYEPWTIVDRVVAPWHDTRFRGYGQNKIVHIASMNSSNFKFVVLSNAFIVHRSHQQTTVRLRLVASKTVYDAAMATKRPVDRASIYGHTKSLFDNAQQLMAAGTFNAVLDPATINGKTSLSWWKSS